MQPVHRILSAVVLVLGLASSSAGAWASTVVYTSATAFMAQLAPGAYTASFSGLANPPPGPAAFSGGGFSYAASAPGDLYLAGGFLGASQVDAPLTINFTSGNVRAIGANFYATNISDVFQPVAMTLTLSDGLVLRFTPTTLADSYRGFVSTAPITSLVISGPGASLYAGLDNLTVGAVPEPRLWVLMAIGLAAVRLAVRRKG